MNVGDVIDGKYRLVRLIGEGGMGAVYEATHARIRSKRAAVKILHPGLADNYEVIARFEREAEAAAAVGHEGIIDVYDLGQCPDGAPFLIMEFLEGRSLADALGEDEETGISEPLDIALSVFIACSVLSALSAAHEAGIIHRDLKPDNIFLVDTGAERPKVKILDFGIARITEPGDDRRQNTLTRTGAILGTPFFMSPEQALGFKKKIDQRTDLWAMGVILYKCVTGRYPFEGENYNQVMAQIISEKELADPSSLNPKVPQALGVVIGRAIERDIDRRYTSADEMLDDLRPMLGEGDLGLLDYHARRSTKRPVYDTVTGPVSSGPSPSSPMSQTPMSAVVEAAATPPRSLWFPLMFVVVLVAVLGTGGGMAALFWNSSRGIGPSSDGIAPPPPRPAASAPMMDTPAPPPATPTPTVQPLPQDVPSPADSSATTARRPLISPRDAGTHFAGKRLSSGPDAGPHDLDYVDTDEAMPEPPAVPARAKADQGPRERPRNRPIEPERSSERPPNRYPARPPSRPNYGHELPRSRTPNYGQEL